MIEKYIVIKSHPNYAVSNLGNVKNVSTEQVLKPHPTNHGYLFVGLTNNKKKSSITVHKLVSMAFLNHIPNGMIDVIDHIDNNKLNNRLDNLQITTQRSNVIKGWKRRKKTSKYTGVSWDKTNKKWVATLRIDGKYNKLGCFKSEYDAHLVYEAKVKEFLTITNK